MKKTHTQDRPQPAQIDAIERCIKRGDPAGAHERLNHLQAAFPGFKPLKRLAYEIACQSGDPMHTALAAWEWCAASPNSTQALNALAESSVAEFPYLYLQAAERLAELGEGSGAELPALRAALSDDLSAEEGRRLDLSSIFLGTGKIPEAGALVESIPHPTAQNNYAQALFGQGQVERAEAVWAALLERTPEDYFALQHLLAMRLWLVGRAAALPLAERLLALLPKTLDEACRQLDGAILLDWLDRADAVYLATLQAPWYMENTLYDEQAERRFHLSGALVAWRRQRLDEAMTRLDKIGEEDAEVFKLRAACALFRLHADTPDWTLGKTSQWWPIAHIRSLHPEKFVRDSDLFDCWRVPMPHPDYLDATALNGGKIARGLALAALQWQAKGEEAGRPAAVRTLVALLQTPCGPDSVRSELHGWLSENGLLEKDKAVPLFVGGKIVEVQPLEITVHTEAMEEETVLDAEEQKIYFAALDHGHQNRLAKARPLMEKLLARHPDYPRLLTACAALREAGCEPLEQWAPLIRRAAAVAPDYFFARTGLVKLLLKEGKPDEARAQLAPLLELKEMHASEWRSLLLAQIELSKADGDLSTLVRLNGMLRDCIARFG